MPMLMTFEAASALIAEGKTLHIAGTESLLRKLPQGNWIGGSTEYFMSHEGGKVSGELLFVTIFSAENFTIRDYDAADIKNIAADAFDNGFTIVILPFDSEVHKEYAENAAAFPDMFIKHITGWIAGINLDKTGQMPVAVNGMKPAPYTDKAVALHLEMPAHKSISLNILNIFTQDEKSPVFEFTENGFSVEKCLVNGKETLLADFLGQNNIDTKLPLVGNYSGHGINISFKSAENGVVNFYAPVFSGVKYRLAKNVDDYAQEFNRHLDGLKDTEAVFSCNCILNFLYGDLEGKNIEAFHGPITFGEIAYQLVNQTLVYVTIKPA